MSRLVMPRKCCGRCLRPVSVCYCSQIQYQQHNRWPVFIVQDTRESSHAIGTARIAALSLSNCRLTSLNPDKCNHSAALDEIKSLQPVLVYPGDNASELSELAHLPVSPLLFIDASWRRSRKIMHTQPWLADLPRYALRPSVRSRYRIRRQPSESALSTLEAIVYTLQQLETAPERFNSLLATMDWVVNQQIKHIRSNIPDKESR
jgi:DTW domain-containing protein